MTEKRKPILCLDFDGVIHDYLEGWRDGTIYGSITPGFLAWAEDAKNHFKLVIYSSRSKTAAGRAAMREWLIQQIEQCEVRLTALDWFEFAHEKPPAFLTIDDRCIQFDGSWQGMPPEALLQYKTWSQMPAARGKEEAA
jgi:hypothetical protein